MRKKTIAKRPMREKVYKLPTKPSTRSQERTFTPSPFPPTSPHRTDPMTYTKNPSRFPPSAKLMPPLKEPPSKPRSSKPISSKGKRPAAPEPTSEPTQPKTRFRSAMNNDFYEGVIKYHTLCLSFLADLPNLKKEDEDPATDADEEADSEGNGSNA
ncbi:extensin-like [Arachis stenosperma]|uniref:extensin-like n=1 Tax=Arachis stenosperma TaxID=217475 RepID=UPI0025AC2357|nr:extensin-like [Arachis stenosperma]